MPTVRPSAKTSIFAPARCGVDPLRPYDGHERDSLAALERVCCRGQDLFVQIEHLDLGLLLHLLDEGLRQLLFLLLGQVFLHLRADLGEGTVPAALRSVTLMMCRPNCVVTMSLMSPALSAKATSLNAGTIFPRGK